MRNAQFIIVALAAALLLAGCKSHKQTQTETHITEDVEVAATTSQTTEHSHKRADSIFETRMTAADSVVMEVTADSIVAADGSTIYNARVRVRKHKPTSAMSRETLSAASDSMTLTRQHTHHAAVAVKADSKRNEEVTSSRMTVPVWLVIAWSIMMVIYTAIVMIRIYRRNKTGM